MNLKLAFLSFLALIPCKAHAGEWSFDYSGHAQALYGYSDVSERFEKLDKNNEGVGAGDVSMSATYELNEDYSTSFNLDLMAGVDQELQDYNQGKWGEEAYLITDSPYGRLMLGQTSNVAAQFHDGAPSVGALANNNDVVDFIRNPNWQRDGKTTKFATLNTTYINTDGVAPKASYITPSFYNTYAGFTYVPDSYNRRGLINKDADYEKDDGYIGALYTQQDLGFADISGSLGYAEFHDDDKEISASLKLSRGGWSLGGGYRKTYIDGPQEENNDSNLPLLFDNYREGEAWDIGLGYDIGPYQVALSYFESKASRTDNKDKVFMLSNQYQINKYAEVYLAAAHVDFEGANHNIDDNNQGYAFVSGLGFSF